MYASVHCGALHNVELGALFLILSHSKKANLQQYLQLVQIHTDIWETVILLLLLLNLLNTLSSCRVNLTV